MNLSLDEYISQTGLKPMNNGNCEDKEKSYANSFDRRGNELEEDEDDDLMDCERRGIWKAPSSKINLIKFNIDTAPNSTAEIRHVDCGSSFDLREKINELPNCNSQNWRLIQPNVNNNRPSGMPPLVPVDAPQQQQRQNNGNRRNRFSNRNWGVNKHHQRQNVTTLKQAMHHLTLNGQNNDTVVNIKVPFNHSEKLVSRNETLANVMAKNDSIKSLDRALLPNLGSNDNLGQMKSFKEILNINNNEILPQLLARKMLDFITNNNNDINTTQHKPIYDMSIHKEIHQLQGKSFLYECGTGGSLLTGDGPGIHNVHIKPNTTNTSLNCRFS